MKYENFEKVEDLVKQIKKKKETLQNLEDSIGDLVVFIHDDRHRFNVLSISSSHPELSDIASSFLTEIKHHYRSTIEKMLAELETL